MSRKVGENVGCGNCFLLEICYSTKYDPWECKECIHVHSSSMIWACIVGKRGGWMFLY